MDATMLELRGVGDPVSGKAQAAWVEIGGGHFFQAATAKHFVDGSPLASPITSSGAEDP